ncbi:MAG: nicotinate (nicotinamide) nucleotide adenylyltransferase [Acidobacteriaceae bacterium]|nr:nicotinate (nicotinamide) nucleotide adenylyltransferase [Acidobacteriaceae bacterium]MBV9297011.1 nicotinate (nicotinamide) nucleotide adenylyltransferase [Acidobacteriaceae bacterium]MBV9766270.1 nicotinate (nicotinamide) nucleotide adenylyltransferase [Acidobacteriaceae bacterium]
MRICLFGGTFDPIHNAHLLIAEKALEQFSLSQVLFVPAAHPPHKDPTALTPYDDRFRMVEIACAHFPAFAVSRLEEGSQPSYTVDTLNRVTAELKPTDELFFLIGSDAFDELESWKDWKEVVKLTAFIVVTRPGGQYHIPANARVLRLDNLALPVSSSSIRARLAAGEPTPELPPQVRKFIEARALYGSVQRNAISLQ